MRRSRACTPQMDTKNDMKWVALGPQGLKLSQSGAERPQEHPWIGGLPGGPIFDPNDPKQTKKKQEHERPWVSRT